MDCRPNSIAELMTLLHDFELNIQLWEVPDSSSMFNVRKVRRCHIPNFRVTKCCIVLVTTRSVPIIGIAYSGRLFGYWN